MDGSPGMTLRDWLELAMLIVLTISSVARWIQRRETNDQTLGRRVASLEEHEDDKVDAAELDRVEKALEKTERDLRDLVTAQGTRFHNKVTEFNVAVGMRIETLRLDIVDLRRRIDAHIDQNQKNG